ncbi:DUF262 domain-containing protein [Oscillatoriales cyanobacterium LEGE 11467]|uniref:DUF262 domain-containing protein n=1 Tax=Zarconia navalis LEGE 11467 TaxID=1828826 RepID=A0A928W1A7_9CYAN|nr:DUF262 domain-containing protein [Zarconia navalis]MBE9042136.1 DUF262 domain-containing protein [Zarconia navalis LEGE 11467]
MNIVPRGMTVTEAYRLYRSGNLLVNRKYQRKLVWTEIEKQRLIGSILKGYPIPLILLAERPKVHGSGKYEIIDGMQRLNAILGFIENLFSFDNKYFNLSEFSYANQLANAEIIAFNKEISKLSPQECAEILDYQLAVTIYTAMEEDDITEVFGRINSSGKHLSNQDKRQAGVTTAFAEVVRKIAIELRGDVSPDILNLYEMPEISINSGKSNQGYGVPAEDTLWCKQGILSAPKLRDSEDEDMIADLAASILLHEPLKRNQEHLNNLYDLNTKQCKEIEASLAVYTSDRLQQDIIKTFSTLQETIELYSQEYKCLLHIVNPRGTNPIPQAFYTIFMAFFDLIINQELTPCDPTEIMQSLKNLQNTLNIARRHTKVSDRKKNINKTKGLIQDYFLKQEPSALGSGSELAIAFKNSLLRSRMETSRYECKQGLLNLSKNRSLNKKLIEQIIKTICGIANVGPESDGYIHIGVADCLKDSDRIKSLDEIHPIEINKRYVVGIDREAKIQNKKIEDYVKILTNAILNSNLSKPLKNDVLAKFDTISYKGYSVVRITIPPQADVSFVGDIAFTRKDSSTVKVEGAELIAVSRRFQK